MAKARAADPELFRALFASSPYAITMADSEGYFLHVNDAACELFGQPRERLLTTRVQDLVVPDTERPMAERYTEFTRERRQESRFVFLRGPDGERVVAELSAFEVAPGTFAAMARDVTELDALRGRVEQGQRAEAVAQLAGHMAHDFNNALMVITSLASLVSADTPDDDSRQADLKGILDTAKSAASRMRQLLAYARRERIEPQHLDLNEVMRDLDELLRAAVGQRVEVELSLAERLWPVFIDRARFEQVIMNLVLNARDAMPEGGTLRISTSNQASCAAFADDHVLITVEDTGLGMEPGVLARAHEPFFTTKPSGSAAGLGLPAAHGLIAQAGGDLALQSMPRRGTRCDVRLPRTHGQPVKGPRVSGPGVLARGDETVLVIDDEPSVRDAVMRMLAKCGYQVWPASSGREALSLYGHALENVDVVVCDYVMPGMSGPATVAALRQACPELPVLFITAYSEHAQQLGMELAVDELLMKPFTDVELSQRVRALLDRTTAASVD